MFIEKIGSLRNLTVMAVFVAIAMFAMVGQGPKSASADHRIAGILIPHAADQVLVCHSTGSATNPFVLIRIDVQGLTGHFDAQGNPLHGSDFVVAFLNAQGQIILPVINPITGACVRGGTTVDFAVVNVTKVCVGPVGADAAFSVGFSPFHMETITCAAAGNRVSFVIPAGSAATLTETVTGANAANISTHIECTRGTSEAETISLRTVTLPANFVVAGSTINCTVTNTAPVATANVTVVKECVGTTAGNFSFTVGGVTRVLTCTGATNTTTFERVAAGSLTLTEVAGTDTNLAGFTTGIRCVVTGTTTVFGTPSTTASIGLTLVGGTNVTCTVTNTRLGTVNVTKVCEPGITGTFAVTLGTRALTPNANLACGETGTFANVALTTTGVTLAENLTPAQDAVLNTAIACAPSNVRQAGSITFNVAAGSVTNCFVINFRKDVRVVREIAVIVVDGRRIPVIFDGNAIVIDADIDIKVDSDVDVHVNNTNTNTNVNTVNPVIQADVHITNVIPTGPGTVGGVGGGQQQQQQQQAAVTAPVVSTAGVIAPPRTGDAGLVSENAGGSSTGLLALAIVAVGGTVLVGATLYKRSLS